MSFFFLLVGLEIKRELLIGSLSDFKTAAVPFAAAIGGMVFPALIFMLFNHWEGFCFGMGYSYGNRYCLCVSGIAID
jgi:NhaA family Na+:H+ antiporter